MNTSPSQTSRIKWKDAPTRRVNAAGTTFVYRQLGPAAGVPLILLNHWGAGDERAKRPCRTAESETPYAGYWFDPQTA